MFVILLESGITQTGGLIDGGLVVYSDLTIVFGDRSEEFQGSGAVFTALGEVAPRLCLIVQPEFIHTPRKMAP